MINIISDYIYIYMYIPWKQYSIKSCILTELIELHRNSRPYGTSGIRISLITKNGSGQLVYG